MKKKEIGCDKDSGHATSLENEVYLRPFETCSFRVDYSLHIQDFHVWKKWVDGGKLTRGTDQNS